MSVSSMTSSDLVLSTLTVSSINGLPPGTGSGGSGGTTIFSTLGVSSLNATSTITTSTLIATGRLGIGSTSPNAPLDVAGQIRTATTATNCIVAMTSGNGSFGSIESFNLGNTSKLPLALNAYGGNIGIGKTNPSQILDVAGAINCTSFLVNGTAVATGTGSVWGVSGSSAYYTSGNVGINTTAAITNLHVRVPTYSSPVLIVDAGGQGTDITPPRGIGKPLIGVGAYSWSNVSSGDYYGIGFGYNGNNNATMYYAGEIGFLIQNTGGGEYGDLVFSTRPTTTHTTIASERMRITSAGNVGIGVTNPINLLNLQGTGGFTGMIGFNNSGNPVPYVGCGYDQTNDGFAIMLNQGTTFLNIESVFVKRTNGYVGIGKTNPSQILDVAGAINCTSFLVNGTAVATGTGSVWGVSGSSAYYTSGNVGIGTADPQNNKLRIFGGNSNSGISLGDYQTTAGVKYIGITNTSDGTNVSSSSGFSGITFGSPSDTTTEGYLAFHTHDYGISSGERVRIDKSGNVGIGTTAPVYPTSISNSGFINLEINRTGAGTNYGVGTLHSLTSSTGSFRGEYAFAFGGATTIATSAQSQAYGYYAIDLANAGVFGTNTGGLTSSYFFMTTSSACFPKTNVGIGTASTANKLSVYSTTANDGILFRNAFNSSTGSIGLYTTSAAGNFIIDGTADAGVVLPADGKDLFLGRTTSLYTSMVVKGGTGYVGIGTAVPLASLQITNSSASGTGYGSLLVDSPNSGSAGGCVTIRNSAGGANAFASLIFEIDGTTSCGVGTTPTSFAAGNGMLYCQNVGVGNNAGKLGFIQWNGSAEVETMTILPSGNVGIGTVTPVTILHIAKSVSTSADYSLMTYYENTYPAYHDWAIGPYIDGASAAFAVRSASNNLPASLVNLFYIDGYGTALRFPQYTTTGTLSINGSGGTITSSSDRRIKRDIVYQTDTADALARVLQLRPATFRFLDQDATHLGFIAQDVEQYIPLAVDGKKYEWQWVPTENGAPTFDAEGNMIYQLDKDGNRIVRPRGLEDRAILAMQTLAIQQLAAENTQLKSQVTSLSASHASLLAWAQTQGFVQ